MCPYTLPNQHKQYVKGIVHNGIYSHLVHAIKVLHSPKSTPSFTSPSSQVEPPDATPSHVFQVMTSGCMPLESSQQQQAAVESGETNLDPIRFYEKRPKKTNVFLQFTPPCRYEID